MAESVGDVLNSFGIEDKTDEAFELINRAKNAGFSAKRSSPTIIVYVIHQNTDHTWEEICHRLGVNKDKLLNTRKELISDGIIDPRLQRPSRMCQGTPSELLEAVETSHSDMVFDGTSPANWCAGATYLDEWVHMRDSPVSVVGAQFGTSEPTTNQLFLKLLGTDEFDTVYTSERVGSSLGELMLYRRHTTESLRLSLNDTSKSVRQRLRALEKESEYQLEYKDLQGKRFYWTTDKE